MVMARSGVSARELFQRRLAISYIDFTAIDTIFTSIDKREISLETTLGKGVVLKTPIIASPMDTVANAELCIALALQGGIGVIHYNHKDSNNNPSIDAQIAEIEKVKRFENGFIEKPVTVSADDTIAKVLETGKKFKIGTSVIDTFPVTQDGTSNGLLVGLLRKQDYSRTIHLDYKVKDRMVPLDKLIYGRTPITLEKANRILWDEHILYLPIVGPKGKLKYLVTRTDIDKNDEFPLATKDAKKRLRVMFAVDTRFDKTPERIERGFAMGADGVVVDTSQGYTKYERDMLKYIAKEYPEKLLIGGNVSTPEAVRFLHKLGIVDAYRDGQGSGSICTTAGAIGISNSSATGIYECAYALHKLDSDLRTIGDGGIKEPGDMFKALAIGSHAVMLGKMLAGCEEAPGETRIDPESGRKYKVYRGMGSAEANVGGIRGYSKLPQGVSGQVEHRGSVHEWVPLLRDGLCSALEVVNCRSIPQLHEMMYSGELRFKQRTQGAIQESGVNIRM
jgi:IMP dehydrogenase